MRIYEIFSSINGEVNNCYQGSLCTFVRTAGCNCRCVACDTAKTQDPKAGIEMQIKPIVDKVITLGCKNVTITGGEPMLQPDLQDLIFSLGQKECNISIETNGSFLIEKNPRVNCWIVDWKTPSSGMSHMMKLENFKNLYFDDIIKFVIKDRKDFDESLKVCQDLKKINQFLPKFAFSPCFGEINPKVLVEWMSAEPFLKKQGAVFSYQIHKLINVA